jgi:hypothetical protein
MLMNYDSNNSGERVERKAMDKQFILKVVNKTTAYTGKKMLRNEIEGLVHYIKEIDFNLMKRDSPDVIVDKVARNFTKQLSVRSGSMIDTHEVMKRHIGAIPHDGSHSLYQDTECPPFHATYGIKDPSVLGLTGDKGQNTAYSEYVAPPDTKESFGTRARNTEETNAVYKGDFNRNGIPDILERLKLSNEPEETHQLENAAKPFSSITDKYPRIAKQRVQNLYLLLDSKFRNLSTDKSVFKWTVLHSANTTQGTVNTLSDQIHNIANVQFDRFSIPYVASADNVYKKITMFIEEFSSMSVLINSGRRYHMIFDSEIQGNQIALTPLINDEGRFRFHTPVNILDTITLKFQSPFSPVEFLKDRFDISVTSLNPTQSILTFTEPHQVADGELVHLEGFDTLNSAADFVSVNEINKEQGHIVTFINNLVLRIDVGLTTITPDATNIVDCFIAARRLIIPLRMEYLL